MGRYSKPRKRGNAEDGPDKVAMVNGQQVPLIKKSRAARMMGYTRQALWEMEKAGVLAEPMFCYGDKKYYSTYEVEAILRLYAMYGKPTRNSHLAPQFFSAVREEWRKIRTAILDGEPVVSPVTLKFKSAEHFKSIVAMCGGKDAVAMGQILAEHIVAM